MAHIFRNWSYVVSHQRLPRGRGSWAFQPAGAYAANGQPIEARTVWSPSLTLTEAKQWVRQTQPAGSYDVLP